MDAYIHTTRSEIDVLSIENPFYHCVYMYLMCVHVCVRLGGWGLDKNACDTISISPAHTNIVIVTFDETDTL